MATKRKNAGTLKAAKFILHLLLNIIFYMIIIYGVTKIGTTIYDTSYQIFGNQSVSEEGRDVQIQIGEGESTMNVARKLKQSRVIDNQYSFYISAKLKGHTIMPGIHTVNSSMNYDELFEVLTVPLVEPDAEAQTNSEETNVEDEAESESKDSESEEAESNE
jgi:peptidoglycan lytic transglycosylase G